MRDPGIDEAASHAEQGSPILGAWALIRSLAPYFRPYRMKMAAIVLGLLLEMAFNTALPLSLKFLIDGALIGRDHRVLVIILALLGGGVVITSGAGLARDYLFAQVGSSAIGNLRFAMFNHLQWLSMDFYARSRVGGVLSRFSGDLAAVENALAMALPWGALPALEIMSSTALLFLLDYRLALIAMLIWPLSLIGPRYFAPRAVKASYRKRELESAMLSAIQETIVTQPVVKGFSLELPLLAGLSQRNAGLFQSAVRVSFLSALVERSAGIGIHALNVCIIGVGAYLAFNGLLSVGTLVSFQTVFLTLSYSLSYVSQYVPSLVHAAGGLGHIRRLLDEQPQIVDAPGAAPLPRLSRELAFHDVTFSYTGEQLNLRDLSLRIAHGEFAAFVGPSGSGKSTL
ncbi:MAG: ABC transporter transmembrane domain-containing protein, partial [Blastocatellia bacterium]